jgi:hypothetical protein
LRASWPGRRFRTALSGILISSEDIMSLRSPRERLFQTLAYETGGLCLSVPLYLMWTQGDAGAGAMLMAALSLAVLAWSPLHNTAFDWADLRLSGRLASDRPQAWRLVPSATRQRPSWSRCRSWFGWAGTAGWRRWSSTWA